MLRDGESDLMALCVEADSPHTIETDAYRPEPNRIESAALDTLLFLVTDQAALDADTATAAAALAWYYSGAMRSIGVPVWADGARDFAPITPLDPEPWGGLPPISPQHPVGLRSGGTDIDSAEVRVEALHRTAVAQQRPWALAIDPGGVTLTGVNGPIAGRRIDLEITDPDGTPHHLEMVTDPAGRAALAVADLAPGSSVVATATAPAPHREYDGADDVQRMVVAGTERLSATITTATPEPPSTTTTSTTTTSTTTTTTVPPTTTTSTTTTSTTTTTLPATTTSTTTTTSPATTTSTSTTIVPSTSSTTTSPSTTAAPTTTVLPVLPAVPQSPPITPPPTLPATGADTAALLLRLGDLTFMVGVALLALSGLAPDRRRSC